MSVHRRLRSLARDERGFAIVIAAALTALLAVVAVALMSVVEGEQSRSRRDAKSNDAYQAAEAGTNAYLAALTENPVFYDSYLAKGEATRTDASGVAHASSATSDVPWSSGTTWTYDTPRASDPDWFPLGNGYEYLLQVYPPDSSLQGQAQAITRIVATGRPDGSGDVSTWRSIETMLRPASLADFQTFTATSITYGANATTSGPIFVGEDKNGTPGTLTHYGTAKANLYSEGAVQGSPTLMDGATIYDKSTSPTALCKLNNCSPIPFSTFQSTITTVSGAASSGGISLAATDPSNAALAGQGYAVDAWKLDFQADGTVLVSSCKEYSTTSSRGHTTTYAVYDGSSPPVCGAQTSYAVPSNGAIYSAVDVIVSGTVHGRVTVATSADVVVGGDTVYASNGSDVLGLEAQGAIYIAEWAPSGSGLTLWAAELALNGPFEADPSYWGNKGTLNFYGSTAVYGGPSGAIVMSNLFSTRNYNYDPNLRFLRPPYFPSLGNAYTIIVQREL